MHSIRQIVQYIGVSVIRIALKVFFIFPINRKRVFFESFLGNQYSCNPKYISEYLEKKDDYELVWAFIDPKKFIGIVNSKVKKVQYGRFLYWYYRLTSRVTVSNTIYRSYTPIRKGQYEIQTWHGGGGGYKKTMSDEKERTQEVLRYKRTIRDIERYSLLLTSSETSLKTNARSAFQYKGVVLGGTARNDILINHNRPDLEMKIKDYFKIDVDTKILLYAPTWRSNTVIEDYAVDFASVIQALKERFGGNWVVLRRMHLLSNRMITETDQICINANDYPDMQELLYVADVLISDYSSSIWDFSFTYKPCFLFCRDLPKFKEDRDFYNPITSWGFPLAQNNDELIREIKEFDEEEYRKEMNFQHIKNKSFETGHTTEYIGKIIESMCFGDGKLPEGLPYKFYDVSSEE